MSRAAYQALALLAATTVHGLTGTMSQSAMTVNAYGIHEITFNHTVSYANPWEDLVLRALYISPGNDTFRFGGFFYQGNQWKTRFAPTQAGTWRWTVTADHNGDTLSQSGQVSVTSGTDRGFLRVHPANPRRFAFADGTPFYPVGMEDCLATDGPRGFDSQQRTRSEYLDTFSHAGFNLFRISVGNCAYVVEATGGITASGNRYDEANSRELDALCAALKQYGFRVVMCLFNNNNTTAWADSTASPALMDAVKRYVKYYVDRWGAYVDIWETVNESYASFGQYSFRGWNLLDAIIVPYIRQVDPYVHLVGQEFYPQQSAADKLRFDICMPHNYLDGTNTNQDSMVLRRNDSYWRCGILYHEAIEPKPMPLLYGEWGNHTTCCWHANSALWHRVRLWALFFNEAAAISWHQNGTTYCGPPSNIALRPEERAFTRHFQRFCEGVAGDLAQYDPVTAPSTVHTYGLRNAMSAMVYLYNTGDQSSPQSGVRVTVDAPFAQGTGCWYDPVTGDTVSTVTLTSQGQQLTAPAFAVDMALKITAIGVGVETGAGTVRRAIARTPSLTVTGRGVILTFAPAGQVRAVDLRGRVTGSARHGRALRP